MYAFPHGGACRGVLLVSAIVALFTVAGCGRKNVPSDASLARQSLTTALESWKAGDPPSKVRELSPPITMVDPAWEAGKKLESFEVVGPETDDGANLICPVKVVCKDQQGKTFTAEIKYVVGTHPVITIFRDRSSY
jgi:hypothetical protein